MDSRKVIPCLVVVLLALSVAPMAAQQAGPNTNVLPTPPYGADNPERLGDYYRQRQVEPAVASSAWDPDTILAAYIDFRTVDDPGTPTSGTFGEAWMGVSKSYDRGKTWSGALVPGFPDDGTPSGLSSPLHGLQAAGDPVLAPNVGGYFHLGGLFFERGGIANIGVVTYRDFADSESGDTISYLGARIIDKGSASDIGNFNDKPAIVADVPRASNQTACGNAYIAYTTFHGNKQTGFNTKIGFSRTTDCGENWSSPIYLNKNWNQNQGVAMAINPSNGDIYVVWRHVLAKTNAPHAILMVKSTDGGQTFTSPQVAAEIKPFDQIPPIPSVDQYGNLHAPAFRMNAFPAVAVDPSGNVFVAIQERLEAAGNEPRIMIRTLRAGGTQFSAGTPVDQGPAHAHQVMPVMNYSGGILRVMWYDFRDSRLETGCEDCSGPKGLTSDAPGEPQPLGDWISGFDRKMNVRVAQWRSNGGQWTGNPGNPVFEVGSKQISAYQHEQLLDDDEPAASGPPANRPNLPMYVGGTMPFASDYMGLISARPFTKTTADCKTPSETWRWASLPCDYASSSSYAVWYDNRDVVFPAVKLNSNGGFSQIPDTDRLTDPFGWQLYTAPGYTGPIGQACLNFGSRDGNIYFAEINNGIVVGSPSPSREIGGPDPAQQWALPFYVENPNEPASLTCTVGGQTELCNPDGSRFFRVSVSAAPQVVVSLEPFDVGTLTLGYVEILPQSTISSNVYVRCNQSNNSSCTPGNYWVRVEVTEIDLSSCPYDEGFGGQCTEPQDRLALAGSFTFNEDSGSFPIGSGNAQETYELNVSEPEWRNAQWRNAQWRNAQWRNAQWRNAQWRNAQWRNVQWRNAPATGDEPVAEFTWTVENSSASGVATAITSMTTLTDPDPSLHYLLLVSRAYTLPAECGVDGTVQQLISVVPDPQLGNPDYDNPQTVQWRNAQWRNAQWRNAQWRNAQWRNAQWRNSSYAASPLPAGESTTYQQGYSGSKLAARMVTADVNAAWSDPLEDTRAPRPDDVINVTLLVIGNPDTNDTAAALAGSDSQDDEAVQNFLATISHVAAAQAGEIESDKLFSKTSMPSAISFGESLAATVECDPTLNGDCLKPAPTRDEWVVFFHDADGDNTFEDGEPSYRVKLDGSGQAVFPGLLEAGRTYKIKANYLGSVGYNGSTTGFVDVVVNPAPTKVTLTAEPANPVTIDTVEVTATVSPVGGGIPEYAPTGMVEFNIGGVDQTVAVELVPNYAAGTSTAVLPLGSLSVGDYTVQAQYVVGDTYFAPSLVSSLTVTVDPATTNVALVVSPETPVFGDDVTIEATVTATSNALETPVMVTEGTVVFTVGSETESFELNEENGGIVTFTRQLAGGSYPVTVEYQPTPEFQSDTATLSQPLVVLAASGTTVALTHSVNPTYGQDIVLTAEVTPPVEANPQGTVRFTIDGESFDIVLDEGNSWTVSTTALRLSAGGHAIAAQYLGNQNFADSVPVSNAMSVARAATRITLGYTPAVPLIGQEVTITATVTAPAPDCTVDPDHPEFSCVPAGDVEFTIDEDTVVSAQLNSSGIAQIAQTLPAGTHTITANYLGSASFSPIDLAEPVTLRLLYAFTGFLSPLPMVTADTIGATSRKLGSAVPLKWELRDGAGNVISDMLSLDLITAVWESGDVEPLPENIILEIYSPGNGAKGGSDFRFTDPGFAFNWDTGSGQEVLGTYLVEVKLHDGVSYRIRVTLN